jgi:hypothetical protein
MDHVGFVGLRQCLYHGHSKHGRLHTNPHWVFYLNRWSNVFIRNITYCNLNFWTKGNVSVWYSRCSILTLFLDVHEICRSLSFYILSLCYFIVSKQIYLRFPRLLPLTTNVHVYLWRWTIILYSSTHSYKQMRRIAAKSYRVFINGVFSCASECVIVASVINVPIQKIIWFKVKANIRMEVENIAVV